MHVSKVFQKSTKPLEASLFPLPALKLPFSYFSHQKCSPIEHHSYHSHQNHQGHTIHNSHLYDTTCSYCKQALKSRGELEKHFKLHHILPNNQKCNICDQVCSSSVALAEHKLTHCKVAGCGDGGLVAVFWWLELSGGCGGCGGCSGCGGCGGCGCYGGLEAKNRGQNTGEKVLTG